MNAQNNPQPTQSTSNQPTNPKSKPSVGSLFAGIGGFDLGFEWAGFSTSWQVEIDPICRAVLQDRFPHAKQFDDVQTCLPKLQALPNGGAAQVIIGGFPCQDVSMAGKRAGLNGKRTGLFFDAMDIVRAIKPRFVVLENVTGLINSNDGNDLQAVIETLAQCGYVGFWRVLDSRYFGVPQKRRRVFLVAGLGEYPPLSLMADLGSVERISGKTEPQSGWADAHHTLLAGVGSSAININCADIVAVPDGRGAMAVRERTTVDDGLCKGLDETNAVEARAAGNAVCPQVAQFIASHLMTAFNP
ncbi:Modification methylase BanI [Moraxella lacunata]|uniref:DNA (cytosine-5-)-methyltransferase n=1 Tax=Moraxella lacunata TaxID=477 RepID=A0A378TSP0_MORLA|nr:DNA (cytosine-5-)-methyltransferase [Moraxella lacunata]STZ63776.1 Modification methylase BanI [Moraxella lacunata]